MRAAFLGEARQIERVYCGGRMDAVAARCDLLPGIYGLADIDHLIEVEAIFSTWGMPALTAGQLAALPSLKASTATTRRSLVSAGRTLDA